MFRTTVISLGLALLASSANAEEIKISLQDKSPAQVRVAINDAAAKACDAAYPSTSWMAFYVLREVEACRAEAAQTAQAKADAILAARGDAHIATNSSR